MKVPGTYSEFHLQTSSQMQLEDFVPRVVGGQWKNNQSLRQRIHVTLCLLKYLLWKRAFVMLSWVVIFHFKVAANVRRASLASRACQGRSGRRV